MRIKKRKLKKETRFSILIALSFIFILSIYFTLNAFSTPIEVKKNVSVFEYEHSGSFEYIAYLKNNSLFNVKTLGTGSKIFKEITERLEISYNYEFKPESEVKGEYNIIARIKTDLWSKDYVLIPKRSFNSSSFKVGFPLDIKRFEEEYEKISKEIGVEAKNPTLLIICNVYVNAKTEYPVSDKFTHSLSMPLKKKVFDVKGLTLTRKGSIEKEVVVKRESIVWKRYLSTFTSIVLFLSLTLFYISTEGIEKKDPTKILEKYKDWIVEAESIPFEKAISVKNPEDIIKVAEELGKPIVKIGSKFYVLDGDLAYVYEIPSSL